MLSSSCKIYICLMPLRLVGFLFFILVISCKVSLGQDLIIRIYGDSIRCKVDREEQRFIYFRTIETRRGETEIIARKEVSEVIYGFDVNSENTLGEVTPIKSFKTVQVSVHAGYSWIISTDDLYGDQFESVYSDLRQGIFIDARFDYFLNEELGLGIIYSSSSYDSEPIGVAVGNLPSGNTFSGELRHDRSIRYYGVNLAFRLMQSAANVSLQLGLGLGILKFDERGTFIWDYRLTSSSIGGHLSGSFQLGLGQGFYLPVFISLKGFNLSVFDFKPSSEMNPEVALGLQNTYDDLIGGISMSRFQIGIGLGFSF